MTWPASSRRSPSAPPRGPLQPGGKLLAVAHQREDRDEMAVEELPDLHRLDKSGGGWLPQLLVPLGVELAADALAGLVALSTAPFSSREISTSSPETDDDHPCLARSARTCTAASRGLPPGGVALVLAPSRHRRRHASIAAFRSWSLVEFQAGRRARARNQQEHRAVAAFGGRSTAQRAAAGHFLMAAPATRSGTSPRCRSRPSGTGPEPRAADRGSPPPRPAPRESISRSMLAAQFPVLLRLILDERLVNLLVEWVFRVDDQNKQAVLEREGEKAKCPSWRPARCDTGAARPPRAAALRGATDGVSPGSQGRLSVRELGFAFGSGFSSWSFSEAISLHLDGAIHGADLQVRLAAPGRSGPSPRSPCPASGSREGSPAAGSAAWCG